ncbi:MAG TPA: serine protease [Planktothrix sp.]|jgi:S1-C subfamily serine protease
MVDGTSSKAESINKTADGQPEGGAWAGISRDLYVLSTGTAKGIGHGLTEAAHHPLIFLGEQLAPVGFALALRAPSDIKTAATLAGFIGTAVFGEQVLTGVQNSLPAFSDAYSSSRNLKQDQAVVSQNLGPLAFSGLVMAGVGLGASKLGTALYGRMEFPTAGADEPQRLGSGGLARAVVRAKPGMVRILGEIAKEDGVHPYQGSGFIADEEGLVLTSLHNVDPTRMRAFEAVLPSGERRSFQLLGQDTDNDLAVLKLSKESPSETFPTIKLGLGNIKVGEKAVGLGYAGRTATLETAPVEYRGQKVIDNDFSLNPGDKHAVLGSTRNVFRGSLDFGQSGGPLLNSRGRVIGVMTDRFSVPPEQYGLAARGRYIDALLQNAKSQL